ncbi:MAG: hypothetical protein DELT_01775 [Desulfovibrio sp.]
MKKNKEHTTRFELDIGNLPPLSDEQRAELDALAVRPKSEIDYSDVPPIEDVSRFYRPVKEMTTIRLDADVLAWLRSQGKGYQTKINSILRREMLAAKSHGHM